jgi:pimeloyl-ACP methyl ester carboxylesterase
MLGLDATLLGLALLLGGPADRPTVTAGEFQGWFKTASRGELRIPGPVARRARHFHYVFVGGIRIGRMPGYFTQNADELRALGVPRRSIHFLYPDSHKTVEENRQTVRDEILRIAGDRPERLVIIAHSRGACDALTFALREPEFVRDRVEALFLIQGAFGGTGLADYVLGEGKSMDEKMSRTHRFFARRIGGFVRYLVKHGRQGGLTGLTREASRAYWTHALDEHADAVPIVGPKVFYVEANTQPSHLGLFMRATASYLGAYYGPNDGVVALEDQTIPGLGTSLGVLEAGHADLTRRFPSAQMGRRPRRALIRSIVMAVGRSDAPSTAPR